MKKYRSYLHVPWWPSNGNSLFIPAAGYRWDDMLNYYAGSRGYYWSSSLSTGIQDGAWNFFPYSGYRQRYYGQSIRAVRFGLQNQPLFRYRHGQKSWQAGCARQCAT